MHIQSDLAEKVNILGGDSIGLCNTKIHFLNIFYCIPVQSHK